MGAPGDSTVEHTGAIPRAAVRFSWTSTGVDFARSLVSLAAGGGHRLDVELRTGERAGPLTADEVMHAIGHGAGACVLVTAPRHVEPWARLVLPSLTNLELRLTDRTDEMWWLQTSADVATQPPMLGLPSAAGALSFAGLHGMVALGGQSGFDTAELLVDGAPVHRWSRTAAPGRLPLGPVPDAPIWQPRAGDGDVFFEDLRPAPAAFDGPNLRARLHEQVLTTGAGLEAVGPVIVAALDLPFPVVVQAVAPRGTVAVVPTEAGVRVEVGDDLTGDALVDAVVFAAGHLALGHVVPGDPRPHFDTLVDIRNPKPLREWDREVRALLGAAAPGTPRRHVEKLEDCTAEEKAALGLWRMIGEVLGESQRLHDEATRYQPALYQRQAAQRLLAQLEEYRGAMLCDGVGLGKTYVATTLLVHFANWWREKQENAPSSGLQDRFRVAVLAPQSVVSTWEREALPSLTAFGVNQHDVRVISHSKLSRIRATSEIVQPRGTAESDLEHLLLADLVIVDEAHNFRSISAQRTRVLRDLLRLQPRRDERRRVLLLTATPINNSLDDLMQEVSLLFSRPLPWLHDASDPEAYRKQAQKIVRERCVKARTAKNMTGDVSGWLIHGKHDAKFADAFEFRDDLKLGPRIQDLGKYLKEQGHKLERLQSQTRTAAQGGKVDEEEKDARVAEDLLDRIVVQRSRDLCKAIEREQGAGVELLFRADAGAPEALPYADAYDDTKDVLASLLPLFDVPGEAETEGDEREFEPLTLKVYMWFDVREGLKTPDDVSSVVGLQRALILKRLESSPVSFLITLLRLTVLHAHHLQRLHDLCFAADDKAKVRELRGDMDLLKTIDADDLRKVRLLVTGQHHDDPGYKFFRTISALHHRHNVADTDDPPPKLQQDLFETDKADKPDRTIIDRLWGLKDALLKDTRTLLQVTPRLATIIFGKFAKDEWPKQLATSNGDVDWPKSSDWGQRIVSDPKLRRLLERLLDARRRGQKTIVFSQFSDTLGYIQSVLQACTSFDSKDWRLTLRGFDDKRIDEAQLRGLIAHTTVVTGAHDDRDGVINAFAPFYRLGPTPPVATDVLDEVMAAWETGWRRAIESPIDVLLATDVLAEGVNLQDAALLINYDVHWNPVRMIQRAGRIDRRLKPDIEKATSFPAIEDLARSLGKTAPRYYFTGRTDDPPVTVNMLLPPELERELLLRERLALKTLAIDFTLGLERGTGAEAEWMDNYIYQGISSLNSLQRDRAIEQVASYHKRLDRHLGERNIQLAWADRLNAWFREAGTDESGPLLARAAIGRRGGEPRTYTRSIRPAMKDGVAHWLWTLQQPGESLQNTWLALDGQTWPPRTTTSIPWSQAASEPVSATHLLGAAVALMDRNVRVEALPKTSGDLLMQGLTAISAGFFDSDEARTVIMAKSAFLLQLRSFDLADLVEVVPPGASVERRGIERDCPVCGHAAGMHKCCPRCRGSTANGEAEIEATFGFRSLRDRNGHITEAPQTWCRSCRSADRARSKTVETTT